MPLVKRPSAKKENKNVRDAYYILILGLPAGLLTRAPSKYDKWQGSTFWRCGPGLAEPLLLGVMIDKE